MSNLNKNITTKLLIILLVSISLFSLTFFSFNKTTYASEMNHISTFTNEENSKDNPLVLLPKANNGKSLNTSLLVGGFAINIEMKGVDAWWPFKDHLKFISSSYAPYTVDVYAKFYREKNPQTSEASAYFENITATNTTLDSDGVAYHHIDVWFSITCQNETMYYFVKITI